MTSTVISTPQIEHYVAQPCLAIRAQVPMQELKNVIPQLVGELFAWLNAHGVPPTGAPFIRYLVIDMQALLAIEIGAPVATAVPGDQRVSAGEIPAGRYATLIYIGVQGGIEANEALLQWGAAQGLVWDSYAAAAGEGFGARLESFLTDPAIEPNPAKWETKVAIRLAD